MSLELVAHLKQREQDILALLQEVLEYESPSTEKAAVDKLVFFLQEKFHGLDVKCDILEQPVTGNHLRAEWGEGDEQLLVLCHVDTVWPLGEIKRRPFRIDDGKAFGPGIFDMKGGLVQTYFALAALKKLGIKPNKKIVVLCNSDEEIGSPSSRAIIEEEAQKSAAVLVPEPGVGVEGAVKIWRKGWGMYEVTVTGNSAHAGNDHEQGISAVEELAHQVLKLQSMTDYHKGTTVNVGVISGGSRYNVVPDQACAKVDVRVKTMEEAIRIEREILGLQPVLAGTKVVVTGQINRPPLEATPENQALYQQAKILAAELGFNLPAVGVGGVSDGNFTSAMNVPTLDGVGAVGAGAHSLDEHLLINTLVIRAAWIARILETF